MSEESKAIVAHSGKGFMVTLQSRIGSTNYSWALSSLPDGIVLYSIENQPISYGMSLVHQIFYFGYSQKSTSENKTEDSLVVTIEFELVCLSNFSDVADKISIEVELLPESRLKESKNNFLKYNENSASYTPIMPYGVTEPTILYAVRPTFKYGFPMNDDCNMIVKYGCPPSNESCIGIKYGYRTC